MKKSTKFFVYGGLICLFLGTMIMVITGAVGGTKIVREIPTVLKEVSITSEEMGWDISISSMYDYLEFSVFSGTKEFDVEAEEIHSLYVAIDGGEVKVEEGNPGVIVVKTESGFNIKYAVEDGVLVIREDMVNLSNAGEVTVYVPDDIELKHASLNIGGGTLEAENVSAEVVEIKVGAGEADLDNIKANALLVDVGVGDVTVEAAVSDEAELNCGMGDLELKIPGGKFEEYNYSVSCGAGNVDLGKSGYAGVGMNRTIDNGGKGLIEVNCGMGNVKVDFD